MELTRLAFQLLFWPVRSPIRFSDPARGSGDALNAKGTFRFEREIVQWRDRPLVDLRRTW